MRRGRLGTEGEGEGRGTPTGGPSGEVELELDGEVVRVPEGITVAAALLGGGRPNFRRSVRGAPRGPLCGMGTCQECRVTIDGVPHRRSCLEVVRAGMRVATGG